MTSQDTRPLEGKTAIVTGAAGGIGRAIVHGLLDAGAQVAAVDVMAEPLNAFSSELKSAGHADRHVVFETDIANASACELAILAAERELGEVDILVNNAAMGMQHTRPDHMTNLVTIDEIDPATWQRFTDVNLSGSFYMTRAAVMRMMPRRTGSVINITTSFFTMLRGSFHPYGPSKAGMEAMAAGHATEFEPHGISVNVVVPGGPADTDMVPHEAPFAREDLVAPAAMVPPIIWLTSNGGAHTTGQRFIAADWDPTLPAEQAAAASGAPIGWPGLAGAPVWPGGRPDD